MDKEVSATVKLGIALIMIAVVISIGFTIYRTTNGGVTDTLDVVNKQSVVDYENNKYSIFDGTEISGAEVMDGIYKYAGNDLAVFIATKEYLTNGYNNWSGLPASSQYTREHGLYSAYGKRGNGTPIAYVATSKSNALALNGSAMTSASDQIKLHKGTTINGTYVPLVFINYKVLLGSNLTNSYVSGRGIKFNNTTYYAPIMYFNGNELVCASGYAIDKDSNKMYNNMLNNLSYDYTTEYIAQSARYESHLVRTEDGALIGLAFIEK